MSKMLHWEGEIMWDNCVAGAIQVFIPKDTLCQYGLHTPAWHVAMLFCRSVKSWWKRKGFAYNWMHCSLDYGYVCGQIQIHFAWILCDLAARSYASMSAIMQCWVKRQAAAPEHNAVLTVFRVGMALLQPAGSRTKYFSRRYTVLLMIRCCRASFVLPVFIHGIWWVGSHVLLQRKKGWQ